jgi:hypothetical protein
MSRPAALRECLLRLKLPLMTLGLSRRISAGWINEWNKAPKPFVWTKSADEILETLAAYCHRIIE